MAKKKGVDPDEFVREKLGRDASPEEMELSPAYTYLWIYFRAIAGRRHSDDGIPQPISYTEISAYCQLTKTRLDSWEVGILIALDDHERDILYEQINKRREEMMNRG